MSNDCRIRLAFKTALVISTLLLGFLPPALKAGEGDGSLVPPAEYASLPSNDDLNGPKTTGSLPNARTLSGFSSLVSGGTITLRASAPTGCVPGDLREVVASVAAKFGPVSVESTHRSRGRNWRAGGARHSLHLACRAIDFRVRSRVRGVMVYLRSHPEVGGLKMYRNGIIHIDNGERRSW
ncbi:hypothetical protein ILT44_01210 [Microvirga sp. BT689]|uniref:D-Ala-D-Ala carboxypeptidase family metallohydrolase n=1 Tax=Microvirga arvi TaxID=2778731 RepID=UPI0019510278|nr:D-Ala-D-Ala carboxypeptidase family metallohydrolase [Microvirga arvi]MBM6578782.1 hypothetical protein [Microvirga arvi]